MLPSTSALCGVSWPSQQDTPPLDTEPLFRATRMAPERRCCLTWGRVRDGQQRPSLALRANKQGMPSSGLRGGLLRAFGSAPNGLMCEARTGIE